jgi:hypothetical protein
MALSWDNAEVETMTALLHQFLELALESSDPSLRDTAIRITEIWDDNTLNEVLLRENNRSGSGRV